MHHVYMAAGFFLVLSIVLLIGAYIGRLYGRWHLDHNADHRLQVVVVAEGTVFALLGLLVAFTFAGAYERFDARKHYVLQEASAIDSAYLMIDLLAPQSQQSMRENFKNYLDARLAAYENLPDFVEEKMSFHQSLELQDKIWREAVAACKKTNDPAVTQLFIPALDNMFDVANLRYAVTKMHPPLAIFVLLIGLAIVGSFLAGYTTAPRKHFISVHIVSYVLITALMIYIIIDLELPRMGLMRIDQFDHLLVDVRNEMSESKVP